MDDHRRYSDESEPGWYAGQRPYQNPAPPEGQSPYDDQGSTSNPYDSGGYERPSGAFRLPAQGGYATPYVTSDPESSGSHAVSAVDSTGTRMPVRGPEYPPIRPGGATSLADAPPAPGSPAPSPSAPTFGGPSASPAAEAATIVSPVGAAARGRFGAEAARDSARRPVTAVIVAIFTAVLMVPVLLLLIQVTFVDDPAVRGVVPAVLLAFGLPLAGAGLHALTVDAGAGATARDAWWRAPIGYLPIGLLLLLAAGLAVA